MISEGRKLLTRLGSCVRLDNKNPHNLHVEINAVIHYLAEYNIMVPPTEYSRLVTKMLEEQLVGKVAIDVSQPYLRSQVAKALLALASNIIDASEKTAHNAHLERIKIFGPEGKLYPVKGRTTL